MVWSPEGVCSREPHKRRLGALAFQPLYCRRALQGAGSLICAVQARHHHAAILCAPSRPPAAAPGLFTFSVTLYAMHLKLPRLACRRTGTERGEGQPSHMAASTPPGRPGPPPCAGAAAVGRSAHLLGLLGREGRATSHEGLARQSRLHVCWFSGLHRGGKGENRAEWGPLWSSRALYPATPSQLPAPATRFSRLPTPLLSTTPRFESQLSQSAFWEVCKLSAVRRHRKPLRAPVPG